MEHELEIKLSAQMDNAIQTLDKLTNKMKQVTDASSSYENGIQNIIAELQKMNANLENSDSTAKFVERLRQLMTTIDKLNDVNLTAFRASLNDLFSTVQEALNSSSFADNGFTKIATALSKIVNSAIKLNGLDMNAFKQQLTSLSNTTQEVAKGFENIEGNDLNKTLSGIARNINKINKLDLRKTYETFNSLTRIIDPFLKKINESSVALNNFNEVAKSLQSSATSVRVINSEFTKYDKTVNSAKNSNTAFTKSLSGMVNILKRVFNFFYQGQSYIIDYTEQLNLFNVVMGNTGDKMSELGTKATQFQNTMLEAFGGNSSQQLYYQSMYQSISESMGIQEEYAYIISENLTKLSYDLSSLYNKSEDEVAKALQSGLVGQTRPVRSYGMDITQNSLTPVLESIGITDRTISQLNQAEKEVLRYIAIIRQSSVAHGDMANTIESPANQLRVLKNQLIECQKWFSALFINTFAKALPYINGVVMAIKSVMQAIATLLGIEIQDYNSSIASYSDSYADSLDDIADSADNATSSIKALKLQTLGFDQINNINESDSSSGGSSGVSVGGGGIDQRLLDAMTGYDNAMDSVRMKATEIRDKIMEWLGFTKKIDPLTKEISWQLNKGFTKIKLIGGVIATLVGIGIVSKLTAIVNGATKLQKILGSGGILTSMKSLVSPVGRVVSGIVLLGTSSLTAYNYMKNLTTSVDKSEASFAKLAISITGAIAGGALIGSVFGPMGIAVGAVTGTVVALVSALSGYKKGVEELAKSNIYGTVKLTAEELEEVTSGIGTHFEKQSSIISTYKTNISSLETEWNSSINTLEKYGATYGVLKQQITEDDIPAIISSIETLGTNTKNIIEESTNYSLDLWSSMMTGTTSVTKEEQANILSTILENGSYMKSSVSEIQNNITGTYQNAIATRGYLTDEEYNYISEQLGKLKALTNVSMSTAKTDLEMLQKDINSGRISLSEEGYNELITKIKEKEQLATDEAWEIRRKAYEDAEQQKAIAELAGKSAEEIQEAYQSQIKIADEKYEEAIAENQQQVLNLMETLESTVASKRKDYISNAGTWGQKLYQKITGSYTKIYTDEEKATINHYDSMLEEIDSYKSNLTTKYEDLATDTIDGYTNALEKGTSQIKDSTARVFEMVPATTQEVLDSHSPSKRFFKLGNDTLQGYINGLNDKTSTLTKTISDILKKIKSQFESVKLSLNINTNIEGSLNSILSKLETFANKFRSGINNILSNMTTSMNSVYVGGNNKLYYSSMPYISVPKFANGGFPEDGLFYANHNELVGQFANGKTAVANNNQIIEGIKQGVYEALRSANNNGINQSSIKVYASKDVIVETAINGINNITKQTGENPIEMW